MIDGHRHEKGDTAMDCCGHEGHGSGDARFEIRKVADGVHAAVAAPAYKVNSNTAIIESDDGVIIVDTHSKPSAARVIVERLRDLTPKPVRYVVNTHFHWDHWHGNEVYPAAYPNAEIVTNQITREAMLRSAGTSGTAAWELSLAFRAPEGPYQSRGIEGAVDVAIESSGERLVDDLRFLRRRVLYDRVPRPGIYAQVLGLTTEVVATLPPEKVKELDRARYPACAASSAIPSARMASAVRTPEAGLQASVFLRNIRVSSPGQPGSSPITL